MPANRAADIVRNLPLPPAQLVGLLAVLGLERLRPTTPPGPRRLTVTLGALGLALVEHRGVLAEERVLAERFGPEWTRYRGRVRRYVPCPVVVQS